MKKIFVLFALLVLSSKLSAQCLTIEKVVWKEKENFFFFNSIESGQIYLSDGTILIFKDGEFYDNFTRELVITDFRKGQNYRKGTMVKKQGNEYQLVKIEKDKSFYQYEIVILDTVKLKKIKEAKIYQVTAENKSSMYGAFSYSGYLHKEAKGEIKANSSGGPRTIINVIFTDNTFVSLDVADDPIWFEAKKGMNVEIYECNNATFYKLLFD